MDELLKQISLSSADFTSSFTIWEVITTIILTFLFVLFLTFIYKITHQGVSYSKTFVHSMVLIGVTISVIMLLIGSNLARAFALVGALSIIRFRNAVKDTRDVSFIFVAMGIGMACGTRFYLLAFIFTASISAIAYFLYRFEIGAKIKTEMLLRVHVPETFDADKSFKELFFRDLHEYSLISIDALPGKKQKELIYSILPRRGVDEYSFLENLRRLNPEGLVSILTGQQNVLL
ncbi:MAG: DUF4956 domain-containing protein [Elusimicrobia bacterium]|nr:DUF4956 domain-containing protein [Candidatus Obscuribacterium magneticum]